MTSGIYIREKKQLRAMSIGMLGKNRGKKRTLEFPSKSGGVGGRIFVIPCN
ncbi:MAG: hypothetical protein AABY22_09600 [Nanoarchaeota archaeon]